jgi:hypothetical protein
MKARFEQLYNDLFWSIYDSESDEMIRWSGYNDAYWWNSVSIMDQFQVHGKYRLNPETNEVTIQ